MKKLILLSVLFTISAQASPEFQIKHLPGIWETENGSTLKIEAQTETSVLVYKGACNTFYPDYVAQYSEDADAYLGKYIEDNNASLQVSLNMDQMVFIKNTRGAYEKGRKNEIVIYKRRQKLSRYCEDQ